MRRALALCATLLLVATAARAGVDLSWDACSGNPAATGDKSFVCDGSGVYELYGNVQPSAPLVDFLGLQGSIGIASEIGDMPEFWSFEIGGANVNALAYRDDGGGSPHPNCSIFTPFGSSGSAGHPVFQYDRGPSSPNRALLQFADARVIPIPSIAEGSNMYAFTVVIDERSATTLEGCGNRITLGINQLDLASASEPTVSESGPGLRGLCVGVNGASPTSCVLTPAVNHTWGAIKTLYR